MEIIMDAVIEKAVRQRDYHKAQIEKLEGFLATYYELTRGASNSSVEDKIETPQQAVSRPRGGVGAETLAACVEIIEERGPLATRDLLPLILARGISVGGSDPNATLAARISQKGKLIAKEGRWHLQGDRQQKLIDKEAADSPGTERSAASVSQTEEEANAPALADMLG